MIVFVVQTANLTPPPPHPACHDSSGPTRATRDDKIHTIGGNASICVICDRQCDTVESCWSCLSDLLALNTAAEAADD